MQVLGEESDPSQEHTILKDIDDVVEASTKLEDSRGWIFIDLVRNTTWFIGT
jgi:hypothetical protein